MRKTIKVERERSLIFCDICEKEIDTYNSCSICNRELCDNCSKDMKYSTSMWYSPCPICIKWKGEYFEVIKKCFEESEKLRDKGIALMNKWGDKSKGG
jgi:hypothetical protein